MPFLHQCRDILIPSLLFIPSIYLWKKVYDTLAAFNDDEEFHRNHNCVIMISRHQIRGWPPEPLINIDTSNLARFLEPFLYFINTARYSLDVAVMSISIPQLQNALAEAMKRGVRVRVILNFSSLSKSQHATFQNFIKLGMLFAPHMEEENQLTRIMHLKCIVKDYNMSNNEGYVCMGSMNYSNISTVVDNFEDIVITSKFFIVQQFHDNFQQVWDTLQENNKTEVLMKTLSAAGYQL